MSSSANDEAIPGLSKSHSEIITLALGKRNGDTNDLREAVEHRAPGTTPQQALASFLEKSNRKSDAARLKLANTLADAVGDNVNLASQVLGDSKVSTLRDVALHYGLTRSMSLMGNDSSRVAMTGEATITPATSTTLSTDSATSSSKARALHFRRRLFADEPTAVLQQMIASDDPSEHLPIHPSAAIRDALVSFLDRQPEFNIRKTSVLAAIHADQSQMDGETRTAVTDSLKLLQRVQALTPAPETVKPLLDEGMNSALRVSSIPKKRFIARMTPRLEENVSSTAEAHRLATAVHDHAMESRLRADQALIQMHQWVKGSGLAAVDGDGLLKDRQRQFNMMAARATGSPSAVDLDALFGDMDVCACDACQDVTSPTAYYVDLLEYLRNNDIDKDPRFPNTGQKGIAGTALEKLFQRRPDLQHLQLSCANANTVLPMIDLANEVMEAFVVHASEYSQSGTVVIETWNVTIETTSELLASPSHTRKIAYCILKEQVFPTANLPYFQPLDATRLYLQYLGTSRFELIEAFRTAGPRQWPMRASLLSTPDKVTRYTNLLGEVQDRAAAAEYLGLTPDEYIIIAREALWPMACSEFADDGTSIDTATYQHDIGVRNSWQYWGYDSDTSLLSVDATARMGLSFVKARFLVLSGLSYAETADLVRTNFVNPMMPTGKDRVLLDSIRFSYRFLQHMLVGIADLPQRSKTLAAFLFQTQAWVDLTIQQQIPPTGNDLVKPEVSTTTFTEAEIGRWVSKWFDCLGKLVVLDAGEGPRLPLQGYLVWFPIRVTNTDTSRTTATIANESATATPGQATVLGYLDTVGELRNDKNVLMGFVWSSGRVYYSSLTPIRNTYPFGNIILYPISKQDVTPKPDELLAKVSVDQPLYQINSDSFLYLFNSDQQVVVSWSLPQESCSIDNTQLIHLNGTPLELWEWDRINRFIRLYKKLQPSGWNVSNLDSALRGLWQVPELQGQTDQQDQTTVNNDEGFSFSNFKDKGCGCDDDDGDSNGNGGTSKSPCDPSNFADIKPGFIKELMSVQKLENITSLDLDRLLCLWSDIETLGSSSLYSRLFLTHDLEAMDKVFMPDDNGNYLTSEPKIGDHVPVLVAAFRIKASIFDAVLQHVGLTRTSIITVKNLTRLYRHTLLAGILGITSADLLNVLELFPSPYDSASKTLELYQLYTRMSAASFSVKQLLYIILGRDDPLQPIAPPPVTVLRTTQTIMSNLMAIDAAQPDLTPQEQYVLTTAEVQAKATLIFTPSIVSDIVGVIEGTKQYTTNAPIGMTVDKKKMSAKLVYSDPLTPPNRRATLSVTGSLTDAEMSTAIALFPGNNDWQSALQRLKKQAQNLIKNELGEIFANDLDDAVKTLTLGDIPATPGTSGSDPGDPGTAIVKRIFFMSNLMPYLRSYLSTQSIISTMSDVASVSANICSYLLSNVLTADAAESTSKSAIQVLIDLKKHATEANNAPSSWMGFLLPPSSDNYTFYGYGEIRPPPMILGGTSIPFTTQSEDPTNLWWTAPTALVGGQTISLQVSGQSIPGDLQWKTSRSAITPIPPTSLVPSASVSDATSIFVALLKATMVIQGFSLSLPEVSYFQAHPSNFSQLNFNAIKADAWLRLLQYYELRQALPSRQLGLMDLFKWADLHDTSTPDDISRQVSAVTAWDEATVRLLIEKKTFNLLDVKLFRDEIAMTKLKKVFTFISMVGITDVELLLSWTDLKLDFNPTWDLAKSVRQTIRGKYSASDYEQAIKPSHDTLRKNQRNALIAYLLNLPALRKWGATDADGLFEFFLLDVQMGSCMQTSRTKQAISSVQLFVQRCMLGLEEPLIANDALDASRWQWMSKQTVWTANRKVFLWPENWMVPSLRDDKTPIYSGMESEMLQRDVSPANALASFQNYVNELDKIANLRAVGVYVEQVTSDQTVFHCVAMTVGSPYLFYYRSYDFKTQEWTPWIRITVDIPTYTVSWPINPSSSTRPQRLAIATATESASTDIQPPSTTTQPSDPGFTISPLTPTIEDNPKASFTGCYAIPVAYGSRKLLFIGEVTTKPDQNTAALTQPYGTMTSPDSTDTPTATSPNQIYEIKVSWTEFRSGKWTPKQSASDPYETASYPPAQLPDIDTFQFMPQIIKNADKSQYVSIEVWLLPSFIGNYVFNGTIMQKGIASNLQAPTNSTSLSFHLSGGRSSTFITSSLQKSSDGTTLPYLVKVPYVTYAQDSGGLMTYLDQTTDLFYHPLSGQLISAANDAADIADIQPIEDVFSGLTNESSQWYAAFGADSNSPPTFAELSKPYTNYNWELGFLGPIEMANAFSTSQQFDDALNMFHKVFNPYADGPDLQRVWQWYPFKQASSQRVLETLFDNLKPRQPNLNISKWRDHPFQPFVVARGRTVAYMKWTVMMYINTLIAYGDMYFRQRTLETIPLAIQLYILASHLYGPKMETIPKTGETIVQTYYSLQDRWDAFSNAIVQLEVAFPFSNQTPFAWESIDTGDDVSAGNLDVAPGKIDSQQIALANLFGFATTSYFCLPSNPNLQALRDTIDSRLYNIRNCLDIDGQPLPLALWDAPIDPGELVADIASGLSLANALNDLNSSLPNFRFTWLLARALEMTAELKSQEGQFLSIKEKRDSEALQVLRTGQEVTINNMVLQLKQAQLDEAQKTMASLVYSQESPKFRFNYYSQLAGATIQPLGSADGQFKPVNISVDVPPSGSDMHANQLELEEQSQAVQAQSFNDMASTLEVMAGILNALPSFNIHMTPMGCGVEVAWGMPNLAAAYSAQARLMQLMGSDSSFGSVSAQRKAGLIRQYQDRMLQMNLAGLEFEHINTQIAAQTSRINIVNQDIINQKQMIANSQEVVEFLQNKYTNDDLYNYLETTTRTALYQTYLLAYDLAKKAELAFRFERRPTAVQETTNFVNFGYYNPDRDGLQSSQQLYLALKQMDAAFQEQRGHDYEITKMVSLRLLNPYALLALRETGTCNFEIPEISFDRDFPGHYYRRIKSVSLTIPCVVGPYTGVNATLRLLKHRYRADPTATDYPEKVSGGTLDPRFQTAIIPIEAVAAASAQNDVGAFELSLKDERYVPFEGAGAISSWQLGLPPNDAMGAPTTGFPRPFDYATIADVIVTMRYTSCDGGDTLRRAAAAAVVSWIAQAEEGAMDVGLMALLDIRAEFATEWAKLAAPPSSSSSPDGSNNDGNNDVRTLVLRGLNARLPAFVAGRDASVQTTDVSLVTTLPFVQAAALGLDFKYTPPSAGGADSNATPFESGPSKIGPLNMFRLAQTKPIGDWALTVNMKGVQTDSSSRMWLIVRYVLLKGS